MPVVHPCATDGCSTLTMGELCLACETEAREDNEHDLLRALRVRPSGADDSGLS